MSGTDDFILDVEAKIRQWSSELDRMERRARQRLARGLEGSEEELHILDELKQKQKEMEVRIRALRIVQEGGYEALRSDTDRLLRTIEQTFARGTLLRAPD